MTWPKWIIFVSSKCKKRNMAHYSNDLMRLFLLLFITDQNLVVSVFKKKKSEDLHFTINYQKKRYSEFSKKFGTEANFQFDLN